MARSSATEMVQCVEKPEVANRGLIAAAVELERRLMCDDTSRWKQNVNRVAQKVCAYRVINKSYHNLLIELQFFPSTCSVKQAQEYYRLS